MSSTLIDTNVILRYLLDDNEDMSLIAEHIIAGGAWTTPEVLAEVSCVLDGVYMVDRQDIAAALEQIATCVECRPENIVLEAIKYYKNTGLDFVDCMILAYGKAGLRVFSFDKGINRALVK